MMKQDRARDLLPLDAGLWDPSKDGLMDEADNPYARRSTVLAHARRHPRATAGGLLAVFLILAGVVAAQRLIGHEARPATGLRAWRTRFHGWRDDVGGRVGGLRETLGERWRDLDLAGRVRDLDVSGRVRGLDIPGRSRPMVDRASRYVRDHAVESAGTLAAIAALVGVAAVVLHDQTRRD